MTVVQKPLTQRVASSLTALNCLTACLLLAGGYGLARLLYAPRFGTTLVIMALVLMVPAALVLLAKPRFGVWLLFIASVVIVEIKRLAWNVEVGLALELLEGLLAIALAVSIVSRRDLRRLSSPLTFPVLIYVTYQVLISFHPNLPTVNNIFYALRDVVNFSVPFFAALYLMRGRRQLNIFLYFWLGTAVALALWGLKQHYLGLTSWEAAWLSLSMTHVVYGQVRIFSTLGSADALGMHMAVSIVLALGVAFCVRQRLVRYAALAMIPLFAVTSLYTLTRGAYVAIVVGIVSLALITRKRSILVAVLIAAVIAVGWYQSNQGSLLANRVMSMFTPDQDESFAVRQGFLEDYLPVIMRSPFGLGPDTSGRQGWVLLAQWGGIDPSLVASLAGIPTDNYYFRIALENGWVGLLLFLGLLASVFWIGARIYLRSKDSQVKWVSASLLATYTAMAVSSFANNYFSHPDLKLFFWFSMGVLVNLPLIEKRKLQRLTGERHGVDPRSLGGFRG